jgi:hypothetical protein
MPAMPAGVPTDAELPEDMVPVPIAGLTTRELARDAKEVAPYGEKFPHLYPIPHKYQRNQNIVFLLSRTIEPGFGSSVFWGSKTIFANLGDSRCSQKQAVRNASRDMEVNKEWGLGDK